MKKLLNIIKRIVLSLCIAIILFFGIQWGYSAYITYRQENILKEAREIYEPPAPSPSPVPSEELPSPEPMPTEKIISKEFELLRQQYNNDDIMGYLRIDNTSIDYPVLQSDDNEFYLDRGIDKSPNVAGSLFLDYENDVKNEDKNSIIYGHNMKQDIMFHSLRYYADKNYYEDHKYVYFDTIYDTGKWEVFAFYMTEESFYYLDVNFPTDEAFLELVGQMKEKSYYDTGVTVDADDRILTLSTCTNITDTTRYVLNAKLIEVNGVPYEEIKEELKNKVMP